MRKQSTPILVVAVILATASLACSALGGGVVSGLQATANAVLTQGNSALGTAQATVNAAETQGAGAGSSGLATANAALTQNAGGGNTAATAQPADTAAPGATSATTGGGQSDIPMVTGATNTVLLTTANLITYDTSADVATAVKFYKDQMPQNGWTFDATTSVETSAATVLNFTKAARTATVTVTTDPSKNQTLVAIAISGS